LTNDSDVKKASVQVGQMDRRLTRCVNLLAQFRKDAQTKLDEELGQAQQQLVSLARHKMEAGGLSAEALFEELFTGDSAPQVQFVEAFRQPVEGYKAKLPTEEALVAVYRRASTTGDDESADMTKAAFVRMLTSRMKVARKTTLTETLSITKTKVLRHVDVGEIMEVLEGPLKEDSISIERVRVKAEKDGIEGWITCSGSSGTRFLEKVA